MRAGWWLVAWTVAAGALGCTDLAPTNPYDPQAPEAQQAKGTLDGTLTLPDGVTGAAFEGATVALFALSAPTTALREAAVVGEAGDDRRARFQFDDLPAGQYRVQPRVPGFALVLDGERTAGLVVQITIGGNASLGELILEADEADRFEVSGRVRLGGTEDGTHAGTRVEAVGSPDVVFTDDDGGWLLRLPAGRRTLRITRARYASVDLAVDVVEGRGAQVDDQVLVGDPAQVFGVLALANTTAGNLLTEAVITAEADGATAAQTNPSLDGSFALSGLAAGAYTIHLRRGGYVPVAIPVVLSVGELRDLTRTELAVDVQAVGATVVRGRAERAGADEDGHGGILVEVAGTPFATTTTSAGAFELGVAPGPVTLRFTAQGYNAEERSLPNVAEGAQVDLAQEVGVVRLSGEPGRLRGVLGLAGVQNPETVRAARVELRQDGEVLDQTNPEGDGAFLFAAVPAGRYELRLIAEGYDTLAFPVTVELGRTTELPLLVLAVSEAGETRVSGRVERLGGAPGSHGGIQVEVVGTDYATQTTSEGRFIVQVPPGAVQLRLSDRGYSPQEVQIPRVAAGTTWDHEAEVGVVRLVGEPASVQGLVTLSRLSTPERVQRATVTATPLAGGAPVGTNPDAEGRFGLVGLAAGDWILRVDGVGYDPIERPLRLEVGAGLDVGQVVLAHGAEGPNAGLFAGRVQVADGRDHAGTVVRLAVAGDDLPFATVLTDVEGRFEVRASREERYTLTLERDGYAIPEAAALGSFAWDDDIDLFLDPDGAGLDLVLDAQPVAGRVEVTVAVEPPWIPVAQRTATVEVRGVDAAADDDTRVVGTGETASLAVAATGRYLVTVSRAGFTSASQFVEITRDAPVTRLALGIELNNLAAAGLDFDGVPLEACALRGPYDLRQADFTGAVLSGEFGPVPADACGGCGMYCRALNLAGADLTGADLGGADLSSDDPADRVRLDEADLFGAALSGVDLSRALMRSADLFGADLSGALLDGAVLVGANLASADLQAARFTTLGPDEVPLVPCGQGGVRPDTRLELVNWNQADLRGAVMVGVDLGGASLEGARMAHTDLRGACLKSARMVLNDLTQADLRGADAREASLTSAILSETDFRGADLTGADLVNAVIERARFDEPVGCQALDWDAHAQACLVGDPALPGKGWANARCCRTHLNGANLNGANLIGADFRDADLAGASLLGVTFGDAQGRPEDEPLDCAVEERGVCWEACQAAQGCDGAGELFADCDAWVRECQVADTIRYESVAELRAAMRCVREVVFRANGQCASVNGVTVALCLDDPVAALASLGDLRAPTRCSYADVLADGQCPAAPAPNWDLPATPLDARCDVSRTRFSGARLDDARMTALVLDHVALKGARLHRTQLRNMLGFDLVVEDADLTDAVLREANLRQTLLRDALFQGADLSLALLDRADLRGSDFTDATLSEVEAVAVRANDVVMAGVDLSGADLNQSNLSGVDLTGANLDGANLNTALMRDAVLRGAHSERFLGRWLDAADTTLTCADAGGSAFEGPALDGIVLAGSDLMCARWTAPSLTGATLRGVRARGAYLPQADFSNAAMGSKGSVTGCGDLGEQDPEPCAPLADADLPLGRCRADSINPCSGVAACNDFTQAVLTGARFVGTTLGRTRLQGALLALARFEGANLIETDLSGAALVGANFMGVDSDQRMTLQRTDLSGACLAGARFADVNLQGVDLTQTSSRTAGAACDGACQGDSPWAQVAPDGTGECAGVHGAASTDPRPDCAETGRLTFTRAELSGADWSGADLREATFDGVVFGSMTGAPDLQGAVFHDVTFSPDFDATAVPWTGAVLGGAVTFQGEYPGDASPDLRGVRVDAQRGLDLTLLGNATYNLRNVDLRGLCGGAELLAQAGSPLLIGSQGFMCSQVRDCLEQAGWDTAGIRTRWVECGADVAECRCDKISPPAP